MKRIIFVIVSLALAIGLVSCSGNIKKDKDTSGSDSAASESVTAEATDGVSGQSDVPDEDHVAYTNINFSAIYYNPIKSTEEDENGDISEKITFEEQFLVENVTVDLSFPKGESVTVLDGVKKILEMKEIFYVEDFSSIVCILDQSERVEDGYFYVWEYEINGTIPRDRACNISLESDMTIVYMLTAEPDKSPAVEPETDESHGAVTV